jgi:hypothetical protein
LLLHDVLHFAAMSQYTFQQDVLNPRLSFLALIEHKAHLIEMEKKEGRKLSELIRAWNSQQIY